MKVIGKSADGYLIAASEREIANLFGFYYDGDDGYKKVLKEAGRYSEHDGRGDLIGMEIHASAAYQQLSWLRQRDKEFDNLCKQLRATADAIQNHKPLFDLIVADKS